MDEGERRRPKKVDQVSEMRRDGARQPIDRLGSFECGGVHTLCSTTLDVLVSSEVNCTGVAVAVAIDAKVN